MTAGVLIRLLVAALVAMALLGTAGCGGDDEEGDGEEFAQQANALCSEAELQAIDIDLPRNPAQTADYAARNHMILVELRSGLEKLSPPPGQSEVFDRYLSSLKGDASVMEALGAAAESGDQAQIEKIFRTQVDEDSGKLAAEAGLRDSCPVAASILAHKP